MDVKDEERYQNLEVATITDNLLQWILPARLAEVLVQINIGHITKFYNVVYMMGRK